MRPSPNQLEGMRLQTELARELLSDPAILQAHTVASRIFEQRDRALVQMPDAATQRAILEAAKYCDSEAFLTQRDAILQAAQMAQQRLGPESLAAVGRVAARRSAADGSQERAAERIRAGQATELLEEATQLAASPEIRETIELADPKALLQLDKEQQAEVPAAEQGTVEQGTAKPKVYEYEYPEFTK